ncbi:MAG: hypothetical protein EU550_02695, partial [Promethearchaeota archaeon]
MGANLAEKGYNLSLKMDNTLMTIDLLNEKIYNLAWLYNLEEAAKSASKVESLLNSLKDKDSQEFKERLATFMVRKGTIKWFEGD